MPDTPLNPNALEAAWESTEDHVKRYGSLIGVSMPDIVKHAVTAYRAAAHQTVNSLTGLPNNTVIEDSSGDIGIIFNNEIWYPECNPMSIDRAAQRYAPFIIRHSPEANTNE